MIAVLLAVGVASFQEAFPNAQTLPANGGQQLKSASGFTAEGLGDTPQAAAGAFLEKYGAAFGAGAPFRLVARGAPDKGQPGAVRFERQIDGLPVFDGDLVVGVDAANAVILVNAAYVPSRVTGQRHISRSAAIRVAKKELHGLVIDDVPRAVLGFKAVGKVVRPVWRVEFTAQTPAGDFRSDVDAQTGSLLSRIDLRTDAGAGITRPHDAELSPKVH